MSSSQKQNLQLNPHVSVDCVIFGFDEGELKVLLIERNIDSIDQETNKFSLPGNLIDDNENLDTSAKRISRALKPGVSEFAKLLPSTC